MADSNSIEVVRWVPGAVAAIDLNAVRAMQARAFRGMFPEPDPAKAAGLRDLAHRCWV